MIFSRRVVAIGLLAAAFVSYSVAQTPSPGPGQSPRSIEELLLSGGKSVGDRALTILLAVLRRIYPGLERR